MDPTNCLPWNYLKEYFYIDETVLLKNGGDNIRPKCLLCSDKEKEKWVAADRSSSSNLKKHLKRAHPSVFEEFYHVGKTGYKRRVKRENGDCYEPKRKRLGLGIITQTHVNDLVIDYVINGLHSLDIVENPEFVALITNLQPLRTVLSKQVLKTQIIKDANAYKFSLKAKLCNVTYVASIVTCWTTLNRCYIGLTCHWLDPEVLARKTAVLGCRRVTGPHSYNTLALLILQLHEEYDIQHKVVAITTDNGLNFAKAFRSCGSQTDEEDDYEFIDTYKILDTCLPEEKTLSLPPYERCAANVVNSEAVLAGENAENDSDYKNSFRRIVSKCSKLWNSQKLLYKSALLLTPPSATKWNSLYDSFRCLLNTHFGHSNFLKTCCEELCVPEITDQELEFIVEYCRVLKPVFDALEILQAETSGYMGVLLPTLHTLQRKLKEQQESKLIYCYPLLEALLQGISGRFENEWFRKDLVVAACLHPKFQFKWIKDDMLEARAKAFLRSELEKVEPDSIDYKSFLSNVTDSEFFDFDQSDCDVKPLSCPQDELNNFLDNSSGDLSKILLLPRVKKLFIQYNTSVPASAAVEKAFTVSSGLFTERQGRLPNEYFENLLLLKFREKNE